MSIRSERCAYARRCPESVHEVAGLPLIVMSDPAQAPGRVQALECGADDHLCKPCEPREVVALIRAVLRRLTKGVTPT
mgnify:CR=1 FL=1